MQIFFDTLPVPKFKVFDNRKTQKVRDFSLTIYEKFFGKKHLAIVEKISDLRLRSNFSLVPTSYIQIPKQQKQKFL